MSAESDAIHRTLQEYVSAVNAGELNQWLGTLTDDIVFLPPDQPRIDGKDAVRLWAKNNFFDPFQMMLTHSFDELDVVGPMAFVHGRFALPLTPNACLPIPLSPILLELVSKMMIRENARACLHYFVRSS